MADLPAFILDSFALLAYLQDEPAAPRIETFLKNAKKEKCRLMISVINLGEILYITERRGGVSKAQNALALIQQLPIEVLPADEKAVFSAAHIKANYSISYADSFVVAAAVEKDAAILTNDPEFESTKLIVRVEWLKEVDG
ncbi:MAG: type II toxin-antitoxin system VapC family toxin [Anaerolineales bacterium]